MGRTPTAAPCYGCTSGRDEALVQLGIGIGRFDYLVALAGNPNTGKSTVFNQFTGLRQHTGNWPGKTVTRAEGTYSYRDQRFKVVDLPGTYSLQAGSPDEEVARDFVLFGLPDVTVVVVDATRLERNLNLALQVLEITDQVVICLNLLDEARRHGIAIDERRLSELLGVPVVPTVARSGAGMPELREAVFRMAAGETETRPYRIREYPEDVEQAVLRLVPELEAVYPELVNPRWVSLRLLNKDERIEQAVRDGSIGSPGSDRFRTTDSSSEVALATRGGLALDSGLDEFAWPGEPVLDRAAELRWSLSPEFHDGLMGRYYAAAHEIAASATATGPRKVKFDLDRALDRILTNRWLGFPMMLVMLALVFWITIAGANAPSRLLASLLIDTVHPALLQFGASISMPAWLSGLLFDGVYLATAWVVSVMLPPMAIFFPLFTLLEDFGYLPRVAFNLDSTFRKAGAHGKQALTMCMGFGCNAAGVVATRVIDSPRERLIAIITNNFSLCNGRWPTQILLAAIFIGALVPAHLAGVISAMAVVGVALLGIGAMFGVSWFLSRTILRGEATAFSLELPPYRPPRILQTLYTSLVDRTLIVLWRAIVFAAPAGAVIWLVANVSVGGASLAEHFIAWSDPFGLLLGLNGVILLAYIVAIPANEIVIPTILMLTVLMLGAAGLGAGPGVMFELESSGDIGALLRAAGWTTLTGVNVMLFSLLHNPCSTTLYTIYRETGSARWTAVSAILPILMGFATCFVVAQAWRIASG
ncbi:MAG: ferrous iron transport protein B [marine benthic group bacterium]|nr:ferrous iron transport protein B [Gemmatimonadota bacterium]